ncbi:7-carboxy-7-deazaguanine synthase QueE [Desulfosudis oleivorans]|uniref:7-carboxy-7-deazaguanine synthase n=1 Tax=Desulfosudis oleivorans (strain DSM 6200 / JCM 39069 / Hxd3) TaxID=96561 RepID=A8ZTP3_DESOH|nr:radical SAM protein [Desulfosudis oleivorans]ABW66307.1 Radical SAM domain protein [Desulfosudis oleivorans Hxd3]
MSLHVSELFFSIQGESLDAGLACAFVRLAGCNLCCAYCDTAYARQGGTPMEIPEILDRVARFGCSLVEITGGEPLLQKETPLLIQRLLSVGYRVLLETNGTQNIGLVDKSCIRIVDVKCPSSGESEKNDARNLDRLAAHDQVKFVISDRTDYLFAKKTAGRITAVAPGHILFSTVHGVLDPAQLAHWMLADGLPVRLHLQLHKILWGEARGK